MYIINPELRDLTGKQLSLLYTLTDHMLDPVNKLISIKKRKYQVKRSGGRDDLLMRPWGL